MLLLLWRGRDSSSSSSQPSTALPPGVTPASLPPGAVPQPAPWPSVTPTDLPAFPGSGWEFDEPPPLVVQQRAQQLVSPLWTRGAGSFQTEQTAGRWITYRAEVVRSGKKGIVAYRLKAARAPAQASTPPLRQGTTVLVEPPLVVTPDGPMPAEVEPPVAASQTTPSAQTPGFWNVDVGPAQVHPQDVPMPSSLTLPILRYGMGLKPAQPVDTVKLLQQKLGIADADGRFGRGTQSAVQAFQRAHALTADGEVGPKTWAALYGTGRA